VPYKLKPNFMPYPWGDSRYIQELCHLEELIGTPVAEMWLGAHPRASSMLLADKGEISLIEAIAADPVKHLGQARDIYQNRLPYLFKVLAAAKPLSIQVHPDKATAKKGFAAENAQGIALDDPHRTFRDDNHKPEMIMALTPFSLLCGFRPYQEIADLLATLGIDKFWPSVDSFVKHPSQQNLRALYQDMMPGTSPLTPQLLDRELDSNHAAEGYVANAIQTSRLLQQHFPFDKGVLAPLLMNVITLEPGQALFIDAGVLHSYIRGVGIELMANSDNVIRGGLTDKYVNPDALMQIADFQPLIPRILTPQSSMQGSSCQQVYPVVAQEFCLQMMELDGKHQIDLPATPHIILVLEGQLSINGSQHLEKGEAGYLPAYETQTEFNGIARLAMVTTS